VGQEAEEGVTESLPAALLGHVPQQEDAPIRLALGIQREGFHRDASAIGTEHELPVPRSIAGQQLRGGQTLLLADECPRDVAEVIDPAPDEIRRRLVHQ
jgi:hypothetical protein